ncbi:MAG: hypothetical protein M3Q89_03895 [Verrucomicrobiota bacterium]|nr:hypothetical protein [Verrucomicrobiota bacterium]
MDLPQTTADRRSAIVSIARVLVLILFSLILAISQWQITKDRFHYDIAPLVEATNGVLTGYPHWANYQNRILGPLLYHGIRQATQRDDTAAFSAAFVALLWLFFCILGACAWTTSRSGNRTVGAMLVAFAFNAVLMKPDWLYLWDAIDLCVFTVIAWALLARRPPWVIIAAVIVETFNREIALVLSFLVFLEGVVHWRLTGKVARMFAGFVLGVGGLIVIIALRRAMLIAEVGPTRWPGTTGPATLKVLIWNNVWYFRHFFSSKQTFIADLPQWFFVGAVAARLFWDAALTRHRRPAIWMGAVFLLVCIFGYAMEWRLWLVFVPYLAFVLSEDSQGRSLPRAAGSPHKIERESR